MWRPRAFENLRARGYVDTKRDEQGALWWYITREGLVVIEARCWFGKELKSLIAEYREALDDVGW
jgi:hypothetical protein